MRVGDYSIQTAFLKQLQAKVQDKLNENAANKGISVVNGKISVQISKTDTSEISDADADATVQSLLEKFKSGKKLSDEEMNFIRRRSPETATYIERILNERRIYEQAFRNSPTKFHFYMAALGFSKNIEQNALGDDKIVLSNHLRDAMQEYEKTDEFKEKPNAPIDLYEQEPDPAKQKRQKYTLNLHYLNQLMLTGYALNQKKQFNMFEIIDKKL